MNNSILTLLFVLLVSIVSAQKTQEIRNDDPIYAFADVMPEYPEGLQTLKKDIQKNIEVPADFFKTHKEGVIFVRFVVEKDGSVGPVKIMRELEGFPLENAIQAVRRLKKFSPSINDGQPARAWVTLPILIKDNSKRD